MIPAMSKAGYPLRYAAGVASSEAHWNIDSQQSDDYLWSNGQSFCGLFLWPSFCQFYFGRVACSSLLVYEKVKDTSPVKLFARRLFRTIYDGALVLLMPVFVLSIWRDFATATGLNRGCSLFNNPWADLSQADLEGFCEALVKAGELAARC
jgi:hypothetical protein